MPVRYPGLDQDFAAQINRVLAGQPVDRDNFYEKRIMVFHRRSLGSTLGTGVTTFFTTNGTYNPAICTLPNGKSNINEPLVIKEIGFNFEGLTVSESAGTVAQTAGWYADATALGATKATQFQGLHCAMLASSVTVRQRNLAMVQGRAIDFPCGNGSNVENGNLNAGITAGAASVCSAINNGQNFPGARYRLADPLVILPDQAISIDLQFFSAFTLGFETAGCFTLYGSSVSRGGVGIN